MSKSREGLAVGKPHQPWLGVRRLVCQTCGESLSRRAHRTTCATCLKGRVRKKHQQQQEEVAS